MTSTCTGDLSSPGYPQPLHLVFTYLDASVRLCAMPALSSAPLTRTALARIIDHTLLRPEATPEQVVDLCAEALDLGVGTVCVSPSYVRLAVDQVRDEARVATVIAFP